MDKIPPEVGILIMQYLYRPNRQLKVRRTIKDGDEELDVMYRPHSLDVLSRTTRMFRDICLPIMFEEVTMNGNKRHLLARLAGISLLHPLILGYIKSFSFIQRVRESDAAMELTPRLVKALQKLTGVNKLSVRFSDNCGDEMLRRMLRAESKLPNIHDLEFRTLGYACKLKYTFLPIVPNVKTFCTETREITEVMIEALKGSLELRTLILDGPWGNQHIRKIREAIPDLQHLKMRDCLASMLYGDENKDVDIFLQILSGFKHLQHLDLPIYGYTWIDESLKRGRNGMTVKECQEHENEIVDFATRVGKSCQSLQDVCFGNRLLVELIRNDDRTLQDATVQGRTEGDPDEYVPKAFSYHEAPSSRPIPSRVAGFGNIL